MKKKYLKTVEDIEALRNTDTKIYITTGRVDTYYKFVNGVLCRFSVEDDSLLSYGTTLFLCDSVYIEVEDEPSEEDIGKLCWFWDKECNKRMGILDHIENGLYYVKNWFYGHCRRLTPAEVAEITGYKVEEK